MSQLHVIIGADDYRVDDAAKKIVGDGVGLELIDSLNATNADLQLADLRAADASFATPPFLDPRKVTWWRNVHFLPGGRESEEVKTALNRFAERLAAARLPENQHFILSAPKWLKTSVFAKTLSAAAEVLVFEAEKSGSASSAAAGRAMGFASDLGLSFAPDAVRPFVDMVGMDTRSIKSEVEKLRDYLGEGARIIAKADVEAISSPGVQSESVPWSVTDSIGERNAAAALKAMRKFELELGTGYAVFMSGVIERFFRQLVNVKAGRTEGMAPFVIQKNKGFAAKWDLAELRRARMRFLDLRERAVSGAAAVGVLITTELIRAMRRTAPA